jgi:hypothetical protein
MIRPIFIFVFLLTQFQLSAQFSASAGYRHSFDGIDFQHNHFNAYAHWKRPKRFEFSVGLEFTGKKMEYASREIISDYDHGPPGYSYYEEHTYYRRAMVQYVNMNVGVFFDWAVIEASEFELLLGYYLQISGTVHKSESDHETTVEHYYGSEWAG